MEEGIALMKKTLLLVNCITLAIGATGGPLVIRLYFLHGGGKVFLSSWLETGGWPLLLIPLLASYLHRRKTEGSNAKIFLIKPLLFRDFAFIGFLIGLDDTLYSYGCSKLPVSTSSLIIATQIAFAAGFAFLLVRQKFNAYTIIAVVLLTIGAAVLGINASNDLPEGESTLEYVVGLLMTLAAAILFGFILPLIELIYGKATQEITYALMMEIQMVICFFATVFCTLGMLINGDFQDIPWEARRYELGGVKYCIVLVSIAIMYQCFYVGTTGAIFCGSSLLSGIIIGAVVPVTEVLAVIFYQEKFRVEKGVALILSLLGFVSYYYGEIKLKKEQNQISEIRSPLLT